MSHCLPNRQSIVNSNFAYLALVSPPPPMTIGNMLAKPLGNRITEVRESLGMSLEKLAEKAGLSVGYISRMAAGKRNTSLKNLQKLADALEVTMQRLLPADHEDNPAITNVSASNPFSSMSSINAAKPVSSIGPD